MTEHKLPQTDRMASIFNVIVNESERGAVMLACHIVDDFLEEIIRNKKADHVPKKVLKDTLGYGGAFGSLSMKSKALFVLGLLSKQTFKAIDDLRYVRNKAAHSKDAFLISNHQDRFEKALDQFGQYKEVKSLAMEIAMFSFIELMKQTGVGLHRKLGENPFPNKQACIDYLAGNEDILETLEKQMPKWHVALLTYLIVEAAHDSFLHMSVKPAT